MAKATRQVPLELISRERIQAVVDRWRNGRFVEGATNPDGEPIPMPPIIVAEGMGQSISHDLSGPIEDACHAAEAKIQQRLQANGGVLAKDFFEPLPDFFGPLRVVRNDTMRTA